MINIEEITIKGRQFAYSVNKRAPIYYLKFKLQFLI